MMNGTELITLLSRNLESIGSAVGPFAGALFTAIFLRRNTKTDEFEKIKAGKFKEVADDLLTSGKMTYTEYYKANNFLTIAKKADCYYQDHPRINTGAKYDFDWFVRFYEATGSVSDDAMQHLWAKILAGEIAQPSSFSLKTIDVMKNLSKKDAELFVKICSHSFAMNESVYFLPNENEYLKCAGITYANIMKLNELGLMFNNGFISFDLSISNEPQILMINHDLIMMIASSSGKPEKASITQYPFTEVGKELSTLINESASDEDFLKYGELLSRDKSLDISVHKVINREGNSIRFEKRDLIHVDISATNNE